MYNPNARSPRGYRRSMLQGNELDDFDTTIDTPHDHEVYHAGESSDTTSNDQRLLEELPPHWAIFHHN